MKTIGIIAEYNPFHNGHIYHLEKIKELFPDSRIVLVLTGNFTQRGIPSIMNKWDKTKIALEHGVDLVIELPYPFSTQSADIFARGSIEILNAVNCNYLVFGSECGDTEYLTKLANIQVNNPEFDKLVKKYLDNGINYPTAMNQALKKIAGNEVTLPNNLLGLSYIKEIIKQNSKIIPVAIKRTNNYHDTLIDSNIASATSIRKYIKNNEDISNAVPQTTLKVLKNNQIFLDDYFEYFKYQIYTNKDLSKILDVDEGIENKIIKIIDDVNTFDEFIEKIKTKRYTYNKIVRMINHILCGFTKEENEQYKHIKYLRILGFSKQGKNILREIKKTTKLPIITKFSNIPELILEKRITSIYSIPLKNNSLIKSEHQNKPIMYIK